MDAKPIYDFRDHISPKKKAVRRCDADGPYTITQTLEGGWVIRHHLLGRIRPDGSWDEGQVVGVETTEALAEQKLHEILKASHERRHADRP